MLQPLKNLVKRILGPLAAKRHAGKCNPIIDENTGLENLAKKPLIGWINYHQWNVVGKGTHFMGIRALKNPADAWVYQEIIWETKPDVILEIGNKQGGSTLYLAVLLEAMGFDGKVLALDIDHSRFEAKHHRIDMITGPASDPETVKKVHDYCKGKSVMIIHDANHEYDHVINDISNYQDLIKKGHYLIVEDSIEGLRGFKYNRDEKNLYNTFVRPQKNTPLQAIDTFLKKHPRFQIDRTREKWIITANPKGFLKCIED